MSIKYEIQGLDLFYDKFQALKNINLQLPEHEISAFIGPSGCGKSTLLKTLNRMKDLVEGCRITGSVQLDGVDIFGKKMNVTQLRRRVGMVFQKPNPFPMSVYDNIAFGPRTHGIHSKAKLDRRALPAAGGHLGRSKGPPEEKCPGPVRRAAAAALYRPGTGRGAGGSADG